MLSISKNANTNYLAKIIKIENIEKHPNADRLQITTIDFQNIITGLDAKIGDLYVFFPLECQINSDFLACTNSYRKEELNNDKTQKGFFELNGRVRAVKLRGEKSMGYIVPLKVVEQVFMRDLKDQVGKEFDTIDKCLLVKKFVVKTKESGQQNKQGKKPKISRIVDGQVHLHIDTENFRKNAYKVTPEDEISISYKVHGTSFWVSNILVKKPLNIFQQALRLTPLWFLLKSFTKHKTEYDYIYGSRRVVKNEYETRKKQDYYKYNLWGDIKDELKEFIPKGYTLYGECVGYTKEGRAIQKDYDYGCSEGKYKLFIYRITFTNSDGIVNNLSSDQIAEFCNHFGLETVPLFYRGKAKDLYPSLSLDDHWNENFVKALEHHHNEKGCYICNNKVPEEGIVIRKENMFQFEAYKLKSFKFL